MKTKILITLLAMIMLLTSCKNIRNQNKENDTEKGNAIGAINQDEEGYLKSTHTYNNLIHFEYVNSHDLTYFIVPNYCDYPCSNFFIFSERQQCYFKNDSSKLDAYEKAKKKFIVVSNTDQYNFEKAFSYHTTEKPTILFLSARQYDKKSLAGDILSSEKAKKDVKKFVIEA